MSARSRASDPAGTTPVPFGSSPTVGGRLAEALGRASPYLLDGLLAAFLLVADLSEALRYHAVLRPLGEIASLPVLVPIVVIRATILVFRRRFPLAVSLLVSATLISVPTGGLSLLLRPSAFPDAGWWPTALGYTASLEALVGVYTVTALLGRRWGCAAAAWFVVALLPWLMPQVMALGPAPLVFVVLIAAIAFHLGDVRRRVLAARAEVAERTRRIAAGRDRSAREAAQRERARVAAELQGLVARNVQRMVDQARRASHEVETASGSVRAREAIEAIEAAGRGALSDARRGLGLLREDHAAPLKPVTGVLLPSEAAASADGVTEPQPDETSRRTSMRGPTAADGALVLSLLAFLLSEIGVVRGLPPQEALGLIAHPVDIVAIAALTLPLAWRRAFPLGVALVVSGGFALHVAAGHFFGLSGLIALLIGVYSVWAQRGPRQGTVAAIAAGTVVPGAAQVLFDVFAFPLFTVYLPYLPGACLLGWQERSLRLSMRLRQEQEAQLQWLAKAELERARTEERLRIARELHDVTAHSLSVMTILAGAARMVAGQQPEQALRALTVVEETGRRAQRELGGVFAAGVLRPARDSDAPPGLASLPDLAREMTDAGLTVELDLAPPPSPLSPGLDLSVYRLVQEALTNAAKHAGPTRVRVRVRCEGDTLLLEVADDGPGSVRAPARGGHPGTQEPGGRGLIGMQERARAFGGSLRAGHVDRGGFAITVRVPLTLEGSTSIEP